MEVQDKEKRNRVTPLKYLPLIAVSILLAGGLAYTSFFNKETPKENIPQNTPLESSDGVPADVRSFDFLAYYKDRYKSCLEFGENRVGITQILYHDFNEDNLEEALVVGYTCFTGTAGPDIHDVWSFGGSTEPVKLNLNDDNVFKRLSLHDGLVGNRNYDFGVLNNRLMKQYYDDSGRNSPLTLLYIWDENKEEFVLDEVRRYGEGAIHFSGEVRQGELFEKELYQNLVFRLIPSEFGWTISIGEKANPNENFSRVVTPPYRGINHIYVEGWHFRNSDNSDANWAGPKNVNAPGRTREFDFVTSEADYMQASNLLDKMLWNSSESEEDEARNLHDQITKGKGALKITAMKLNNLTVGERAGFNYMEFDVELILPYRTETFLNPQDFPVETLYEGPVAETNLESNPAAREYRTVIQNSASNGPNFAGHYTFVEWGCGSNCRRFAIVDAITGNTVYFSDFSYFGSRYQVDSNLLIISPPEFFVENANPNTRYFIMEDGMLIELKDWQTHDNWLTYSNEEYGFSFQHPQGTQVVDNSVNYLVESARAKFEICTVAEIEEDRCTKRLGGDELRIQETTVTNIDDVEYQYTNDPDAEIIQRTLSLGERLGIQTTVVGSVKGIIHWLQVIKDDLLYTFFISDLSEGSIKSDQIEAFVDQIVSGFQFKEDRPSPSLSTDKQSILAGSEVVLTIDNDRIFDWFKRESQLCSEHNITSTSTGKMFCENKATFKEMTRFTSIVPSPDNTKIGFTIESDRLSPDKAVGIYYFHPSLLTLRVNFLTNYYLGNEFISFSPDGTHLVYKDGCWEGLCGFSIKDSETLANKIGEWNTEYLDAREYNTTFVRWISDSKIEYKVGTMLKRTSL
jgi:hypothetical protein